MNKEIHKTLEELNISVSIIDYIGKMENGVGILINLSINQESFEIGYWFNREGDVRLAPEQRLLDVLEIDNIYDLEYLNDLIYIIHNSLPDQNTILDEFLKEN